MRYKILVVDDQFSMQELARLILQPAGYQVLLASDGATGLSLARTEHPDLLVLDLGMPGMNGLDVLRLLRQHPHTAGIPALLISCVASSALVRDGMAAGAAGVLHKPFHPPALLALVQNILLREELPIAV